MCASDTELASNLCALSGTISMLVFLAGGTPISWHGTPFTADLMTRQPSLSDEALINRKHALWLPVASSNELRGKPGQRAGFCGGNRFCRIIWEQQALVYQTRSHGLDSSHIGVLRGIELLDRGTRI